MIDRLFRRHRAWHARITDAVSGRADEASLRRLDEHVARCAACRARLDEERALRAALRALPLREPSRSLRLTPAMLEAPTPAPARAAVPGPLLLGARGIAAAAVAAFAVVAVLAVTAPRGEDAAPLASREHAGDAMAPLAAPDDGDTAGGAATVAPFAVTPEPTPGLAPPPTGGAGASGSGRSPGPETTAEPAVPATGPGAPADDAGGGEVRTTAAPDDAAGKEAPAVALAEPGESGRAGPPGWLLVAAGAAAALALAALATLEIARRRQP